MEVLLVDDQAVTVQVYAATVRKTFVGARVHTAVDLPDALERFRRAFPGVPVLVVSASEEPDRAQACLAAGARGYVAKTSALKQLPNAMHAVLAGERYALTCRP